MRRLYALCLHLCLLLATGAHLMAAATDRPKKKDRKGQEEAAAEPERLLSAKTLAGLKLRGIGPAIASGRVVDFAVHPEQRKLYYAATASGGLWKTVNAGTTWQPIFDDQGSYSIGALALDPNDPLVLWVGTGENNSQRSVAYGDGVYKSVDGGGSWEHLGLKDSEHIGMIAIDPRDSDVVYVASQGPLWRSGGERGLYKTTDGGKSWKPILEVDEHTGVNEVHLDPRDPDVLYASTYQRRRRVWTLINGGPGSGIHKSTDGGESWTKLVRGLPKVEMGRIGLALSPANPDLLYAIIEAQGDAGGFFRSVDAGSHWEKRSDYVASSPQYYQELVADPKLVDRVYSLDTFLMVTEDGGKSFRRAGQEFKHVDEHALWIDPDDTDYLLSGCDGGIYESFDRGATWRFKSNFPITQFYKITADNDFPFYNVYGGTQDNNTLGGPARTTAAHGIDNGDWFVTVGGDGFQPRADPENPDIVYSQWQYGNLVRYDRKTGETIDIKPREEADDEPLRWNWDAPLIISPHRSSRLYYAAQRIYRSEDRGDSWRPVSPDLTRRLDRNQLEVMDTIWGIDSVAKHDSTSIYGNVVALSESPLVEDLLYAGTDDGLIQLREPGQEEWHRIDRFPGVPELSYVSRVEASLHDADTVYAAFNNHKSGDFKPYLLRSDDRGASWSSIADDLPERGSVWAVVEDHVDPDLLFAGTEFGAFFTLDGGTHWVQLKGGMPVISVRDLAIQRRENDLIVGTFGRGFYILDDYTPLRHLNEERLEETSLLFPVKDAWTFIEARPLGGRGNASRGHAFYTAPNPPFGAVFTYYLKEELKTLKEQRQEREKEEIENHGKPSFPSWEELRAEARERKPEIELVVRDEIGNVVRRVSGPTGAGIHRLAWDLRLPASTPVSLQRPSNDNPFSRQPLGPMVVPGRYSVTLAKISGDERETLAGAQSFEVRPLGAASLPAKDRQALLAFQRKTARLQRAVLGSVRAADEAQMRVDHLWAAQRATLEAPAEMSKRLRQLEERLKDLRLELEGDRLRSGRNAPAPPSIVGRVQSIVSGHWGSTSAPTATQIRSYELAAETFSSLLERLRQVIEVDLEAIEEELESVGAPWTPGRIPSYQRE